MLIDTTPDFYANRRSAKIECLDAVLYTHTHADHILGIDDLRPLSYLHKPNRLPLYAHPDAADFLRKMFSYIFDAQLQIWRIAASRVEADRWARWNCLEHDSNLSA